mgnify:CR=1 FL=1
MPNEPAKPIEPMLNEVSIVPVRSILTKPTVEVVIPLFLYVVNLPPT